MRKTWSTSGAPHHRADAGQHQQPQHQPQPEEPNAAVQRLPQQAAPSLRTGRQQQDLQLRQRGARGGCQRKRAAALTHPPPGGNFFGGSQTTRAPLLRAIQAVSRRGVINVKGGEMDGGRKNKARSPNTIYQSTEKNIQRIPETSGSGSPHQKSSVFPGISG